MGYQFLLFRAAFRAALSYLYLYFPFHKFNFCISFSNYGISSAYASSNTNEGDEPDQWIALLAGFQIAVILTRLQG